MERSQIKGNPGYFRFNDYEQTQYGIFKCREFGSNCVSYD